MASISAAAANTLKNSNNKNVNHQCKIIAQRANSASLLLDNKSLWASLGRCLIVSISFTNAATVEILHKVVKGILNMPVLTNGEWGDGTKPVSLTTLIEGGNSKDWGLMIIPAVSIYIIFVVYNFCLTCTYTRARLPYFIFFIIFSRLH
jgi:hypothetical protein